MGRRGTVPLAQAGASVADAPLHVCAGGPAGPAQRRCGRGAVAAGCMARWPRRCAPTAWAPAPRPARATGKAGGWRLCGRCALAGARPPHPVRRVFFMATGEYGTCGVTSVRVYVPSHQRRPQLLWQPVSNCWATLLVCQTHTQAPVGVHDVTSLRGVVPPNPNGGTQSQSALLCSTRPQRQLLS